MKPSTFNKAIKIWEKTSIGNSVESVFFDLEVQKKLLNIFSVGDYYYYIFDIKEAKLDLLSEEAVTILGYSREELDMSFLVSKFHPEDQPWFLNIENKIVEFFSKLTLVQIPNYKVRYDYRIRKNNGEYIRIIQQVIVLQHSEVGGILKTFGVHTDISHLKMEGKPVLSFIGLNGEPSFIDVEIEKVFPTPSTFLTNREQEILILIVNGFETKEIAKKFGISNETVSTHRKNLLNKTKARNTSEMISMAIKKGWV
jgi:DNA-binding CsgD family transcriptional regulator